MSSLTKYESGSVRELLSISIPLIITAFSGNFLVVIDRIMLSYYSMEATNAVAGVGVVFAVFYFPGVAITGITEVFVGQYYGAGRLSKIAAPVWQMIWFSCLSIFIYAPIAYLGKEFFLAEAFIEEGLAYYQLLIIGCPFFLIYAALSGFFIGQGRTKLITYIVMLGGGINILLNYVLIFGVGPVPALGATGAAIASVMAEAFQVLILLFAFLSKHNHRLFETRQLRFDISLLIEELKIGIPNAIGHTFEIAGWAFLTNFRAGFGMEYILAMTVSSTAYILFTFFTDGLHKGITAIASNFIGAGDYSDIERLKRSAYKIQIIAGVLLFFPMVFFNERTIQLIADISMLTPSAIYGIKMAMLGNFLFMIIDGFFWIYAGLLTAGGDTKVLMFINSIAVWIVCVLPSVIWLTYFPSESYTVSLYFYPIYALFVTSFLYLRVKSNRWIKLDLAKSG